VRWKDKARIHTLLTADIMFSDATRTVTHRSLQVAGHSELVEKNSSLGNLRPRCILVEFDLPYSRTTAVDGRQATGLYSDGAAVHRTVVMVQDPQRYGYGIRRRYP